jgi:endonuclease YncB( thermonuclease family)
MHILVALLACCLTLASALADPIEPNRITVIDGDTIRIDGAAPSVRLVGFNAPETEQGKYACEAERELGARARSRLRELVKTGDLDFEFVACSCPPGTEGTRSCNYGRKCGMLRSNGRDVGDVLIAEGLAVPFICGTTRCPKTPRPWCS